MDKSVREKIYQIIEVGTTDTWLSRFYDALMIVTIILSFIPLTLRTPPYEWIIIDRICAVVFIVDYFLRWITADHKFPKNSKPIAFLRYPVSPMAIVDLLSILPFLALIPPGLKIFRTIRLLRAFRIFNVFRILRYSKSIRRVYRVIRNSWTALVAVFSLAVIYIVISALVIYSAEPQTFKHFFEAIYWSTVSLTTIGYGDLVPVTPIGRSITVISSLCGIAVIALPSGVITAGYMQELENSAKGKGVEQEIEQEKEQEREKEMEQEREKEKEQEQEQERENLL